MRRFGISAALDGAPSGPLLLLLGLALVEEVDRVAFGVFAPDIKATFGLSGGGYLAVVNAAGTIPVLLALPLGRLADGTSRVRVAWMAALFWMAMSVLTGVSGLLGVTAVFFVVRLASGTGKLVNEPVHPSLIADLHDEAVIPAASGIYRTAPILAGLAGPVAGVADILIGWNASFVLLALPSIPLALLLRSRVRVAESTVETPTLAADLRLLRRIPTLRRFAVSALFYGAVASNLTTLPSLFFQNVYGVGAVGRGVIVAIATGFGLVGLLLASGACRRALREGRPDRLPVIGGISVAVFGAGLVLAGALPLLVASVLGACVAVIGALGLYPPYQTLVPLTVPSRLRATAFAAVLMAVALGALIALPITSGLVDGPGYRAAFVALGLLVIAGGFVQATASRTVVADIAARSHAVDDAVAADDDVLLRCRAVDAGYDGLQVLFGVDLEVRRGEILALLGTNGAGKSTLLRVITGLLPPTAGTITIDGRDITGLDPGAIVRSGVAMMPGGKAVFPTLTVLEHLRVACWEFANDRRRVAEAAEQVFQRFPRVGERRDQLVGNLSGGEQQQLAVGMALLANPRLLVIDELSLGLAPAVVETLMAAVREMHEAGTTVVIVEQSLNVALSLADRAYFLEKGSVRFEGSTRDLIERGDIARSVFLSAGGATTDETIAVPSRREGISAGDTVLRVSGVRKSFGGVRAVNGVDLTATAQEIVGLIGGNGAGKTTIFDLISGYLTPDAGAISFRGVEVTSWSPDRRAAAGLGRSFQDARLFGSLTVAENIAVALERHLPMPDHLAACLALPAIGRQETDIAWTVGDLIELLGLGSYRNRVARDLSTGTRRVVDLAMALAHDPDVLLLDEPSAGIAQREAEALGPLLRRVRAETGCALVVIEHDMPLLAGLCDRMVALELGAVLAEGTAAEVLATPEVIASYLGGDAAAVNRSGVLV